MDNIEQIGLPNSLWFIVSSAFVFLMLVGFLLREAGLTRSKNSANIASKCVGGICISILLFWLVGYGLMFGESGRGLGLYGASEFGPSFAATASGDGLSRSASFFMFHALLCAATLMIVLSAATERIRFEGALLVAILYTGLVYPVIGHWTWATQVDGTALGWLGQRGFIDLGGAATIHSTAGWAAFAMLFLTRARIGRFTNRGEVNAFPKSSSTSAAVGTLLIWLGWFGVVAGRAIDLAVSPDLIFVNVLIAGAVGAVAVIPLSLLIGSGRVEFGTLLSGLLAGLVAVSAGLHLFEPRQVILIAMVGAWLMMLMRRALLWSRVDDVCDAVAVHLVAGVWGTFAVAIFGDPALLSNMSTSVNQLSTQAFGVLAIGAWAFVVTLICVNVLNLIFALRVGEDEEFIGLNLVEQGEIPDYSEYPGLGHLLGR